MPKIQENKFIDETVGKKRFEIGSNLEPKMLPLNFRERSATVQRLYLAVLVLLFSAAIGVITFTLMAGLAKKINGVFQGNTNFLVISTIGALFALFSGAVSPTWSKNRKYLFTWYEFMMIALPAIIYIGAYGWLSMTFKEETYVRDPKKFLMLAGLIAVASNIVPIVLNLFKVILNVKRFKQSMIKALMTFPGCIAISAINITLWMMAKWEGSVISLSSIGVMITGAVFAVGLLMLIIGVALSMKWDVKGTRSIWNDIKFTGALPALIIYSALLAIGVRFMKMEFSMPVVTAIAIDITLLALLATFAIWKGRIKNLIKTRPIYNNVVLRGFVIGVALTGLTLIMMMKKIAPNMPDFGPPSFTILAITSVTVIVGVFIAHLGKIITYSKLFKATVIGSFITLILIVLVVMSIIVLDNSDIILAIIARQVVSLFLMFAIVVEIVILFIDVFITTIIIYKKDSNLETNKDVKVTKEGIN